MKFEVKRCAGSAERPHGLRYSLTLHGPRNERLVGFDNAHAVSSVKGPAARSRQNYDHRHRLKTVKPYEYMDAAALLADFWNEVDKMLKEQGVPK